MNQLWAGSEGEGCMVRVSSGCLRSVRLWVGEAVLGGGGLCAGPV